MSHDTPSPVGPDLSGAIGPADDADADLSAADQATEALLATLRPAADTGRDVTLRLLFRAGQAAGELNARRATRRQLLAWRAAAAVLVGGLEVSLWWRPAPVVRVVYQDRPAEVAPDHNTPPPPRPLPSATPPVPPPREPAGFALATSPNRPLLPSADSDYLVLRDAVLRWGVGVMPPSRGAGRERKPPTVQSLLDGAVQ